MKRLDIITALVMLAIVGTVVLATSGLPFWSRVSPGPRFLPLLLAGATAVFALALLVQTLRRADDEAVEWPDRAGIARIAAVYAVSVGFGLVGGLLGFVTASVMFLLFTLVVILKRGFLPSLLTTAVTTGIVYGVFINWLNIRLPGGPFGF